MSLKWISQVTLTSSSKIQFKIIDAKFHKNGSLKDFISRSNKIWYFSADSNDAHFLQSQYK